MFFSRKYLFTSKKTSYKGIASLISGVISLVSFLVCLSVVLKAGGNADARLGAVGFLSCLFSFAGVIIGIVSLVEKETFRLFPRLGTFLSVFTLVLWGGVIYVGFTVV